MNWITAASPCIFFFVVGVFAGSFAGRAEMLRDLGWTWKKWFDFQEDRRRSARGSDR